MAGPTRVVHYLNQFFGGLGGEEQAGIGVVARPGPVGPGKLLAEALGRAGEAGEIVGTVICGDNYFAERQQQALREVLAAIKGFDAEVVLAGPAFSAGRYGLACAAVCKAASAELGLKAVGGMYQENPGAELAREGVYIVPTSASATGLREAVERMAGLATKLASGKPLGPARAEGYLPRGRRRNVFTRQTGAERAVDMLLQILAGQPFESELSIQQVDHVAPAPPVADLRSATVALVTEGGIVPTGNPDRIETVRASKWAEYAIAGLDRLTPDRFCCIHSGFDVASTNEDPNRMVPVDAMRQAERRGSFGRLHSSFYSTVGSLATVASAERFGREMGQRLLAAGVQAVVLTGT